jgi:hypothetical protein
MAVTIAKTSHRGCDRRDVLRGVFDRRAVRRVAGAGETVRNGRLRLLFSGAAPDSLRVIFDCIVVAVVWGY